MITSAQIQWEPKALEKYENMIQKIPFFHREIAKKVVDKKAPQFAQQRGSEMVEESDIVEAFFSEVPKAFYSLMVRLLDEVGFEYRDYGKLSHAQKTTP
ncbi:MAG: PCP reductase family protein [Candidatus Omnitrophica bacterium]|nr:PCP reductase family protein [Candidatus Omnitrophota bacterium]